MPTFSGFARNIHRSASYEAQDVLAACDDVDIIRLEPARGFTFAENVLRRLVSRDVSRKLLSVNPGLRPVRLTRDYELFLVVCPFLRDVWYANAIQGWRDRCRTSICWIDEVWAAHLPHLESWLPLLRKFDHVIVGINGSGQALGNALGRACHEMQGAVDTMRFNPYPNGPARVIDVYSIGRRRPGIHERLRHSTSNTIFYVHDTLSDPGNSETVDYAQHRDLYANLAKRSRFFMVAPSKVDSPDETQGQISFGLRYFEGAAAGAVLVGEVPRCEAFRRQFDWPEPVIELQPDGSDALEVLSRLSAEPEHLREISRRNVEATLRRHDWVHRWREVFALAGLKPAPAMEAREMALGELADLVRSS
jgi:spore maturation protein CgeB